MQTSKARAEALGRKAKLANSYQELLDLLYSEFSNADLKNVGNYGLGKLIGKGSFGKVYLATHKLTNGSKVVLKSAKKDDSNLAREIHHHRQFVHPHIARLYEVIVTESLVWLVLEYCPGDELYNYLLKHGPLPVEKVQKTFTQLLENILLDKHENVKLVDFGFTREYEGKSNYLQTFCGTICYSAPEMLKGEKYAGEKVDVWSLGVILYALLCGELPFDDDDDNVTRRQILSEEPKYPEHLSPDAVSLIKVLLSKRPLLRPTLPDILQHPFLLEHAPQQQAILKLHQPAPFTTALEKDCLHRMRGAGVDIDQVIESVLAQKCDALAGWWTLLLEKEERKAKRRERRRKEKEAENRNSRRFSAASSKLERMAPIMDEDGVYRLGEPPLPRTRGRAERRSAHYTDLNISELPNLPESYARGNFSPDSDVPPPPLEKDSIRSTSTSLQRRPVPPPKEGIIRSARSRGSTLHLVTTPDVLGVNHDNNNDKSQQEPQQKMRKKPSQAIIQHWKTWKHWIVDTTRRHTPSKRPSLSTPNLNGKNGNKNNKDVSPRPHTSKHSTSGNAQAETANETAQTNGHVTRSAGNTRGGNVTTPTMLSHTHTNSGQMSRRMPSSASSYKRHSLSPAPITPRARRPSGGLRGRKSTSSSLSSIHTMPRHQHTHSKASSTSSTASMSTTKTPLATGRSPHRSVKVLPATPTSSAFPSNIRLVRGPALSLNFNEGMPSANQNPPLGSPNPFASPNILFAKRKKNIFKGPMLSLGAQGGGNRSRENSHSRNASANGLGRRSGEMAIQEEDEEADVGADLQSKGDGEHREMDEESIEEVEQFSPIISVPGERVEEIYEEDGGAADYFSTPPYNPKKPDGTRDPNGDSTSPDTYNCDAFAGIHNKIPPRIMVTPEVTGGVIPNGWLGPQTYEDEEIYITFRNCAMRMMQMKQDPDHSEDYQIEFNGERFPRQYIHRHEADNRSKYGDIIGLKTGPGNLVVLNSARLVRDLLDKRGSIYSGRPNDYIVRNHIVFGAQHILFLPYDSYLKQWRTAVLRHLLGPTSVEQALPVVEATAAHLAYRLAVDPGRFADHFRNWALATPLLAICGYRGEQKEAALVDLFYRNQESWLTLLTLGVAPPVDMFPVLKWVPAFLAKWKRGAGLA
ncbi:hypothetical protein PG994_011820 [Apiospora phragmitis]|uniref:Protein kinase domain-containing protein n=1 Tax=Apiospora phragmitis TaxID=2905665 RepID=A0ABR1TW46_9PEZI